MIHTAKGQGDYNSQIGELLKRYDWLEKRINKFIYSCFKPTQNEEIFKNIVLNSSILNMGQKAKIMVNMKGFDPNIYSKIMELGSIRNGFAHNVPYVSIEIEDNDKGEIVKSSAQNVIQVMNSSGKIIEKDFDEQFERFEHLNSKISLYLNVLENSNIANP